MLRYYEKEGLIRCRYRPGYAYRMYDETAVKRVRQILFLRRLRFSLKQIGAILGCADSGDPSGILAVLCQQLSGIEENIASLRAVRDILLRMARLGGQNPMALLEDEAVQRMADTIPPSENLLKECHKPMEKAENVRILMLPPFTAAAYHYVGAEPEEKVGAVMSEFVQNSGLYEIKPDARLFGFNHPSPSGPESVYGYEDWVTVPEDMEIPAPLTRKHFQGGLYAVLTIDFPDFYRWQSLASWAADNEQYEPNYSDLGDEIMGGCLEEHLNWVYAAHMGWSENGIDGQVDLMLPVKRKERK